ncbi:hypothetical protein D3C87_1903550 [compost metagenome]
MMLAWLSSSETITSSLPSTAETVPELAVKPDWNTSAASVCLKAAILASSSTCWLMVPAMVRTEPEPAPNLSMASWAAFISLGWVVRPR